MVVASAPACLVHTVPECGSGWPGQKARWALIKDRAGTPSRSLLRSSSAQCFVLWLEALHFQRKEDLETSRRRRSRLWSHSGFTSHTGTSGVRDLFSSQVRRMWLGTKEESQARRSLGLEMSLWRRLWPSSPEAAANRTPEPSVTIISGSLLIRIWGGLIKYRPGSAGLSHF